VPQLDIGLEVLYSRRNTAFKGNGIYTGAVANPGNLVAVNGSRPQVFIFDDQEVWSAMFRWQRNFYP
jgi:hypothetical protein